jgi:DNA mismatch endonuclease (patch repair protein)
MTDHLTVQKRSWNMSRIKAKNTSPELLVRSALHKMGYRFRIHSSRLPGKPDIILHKYKTAIFVHGCFWHRHSRCKRATFPKSNQDYWRKKFAGNIRRFDEIKTQIEKLGWNVLVIWECETKNESKLHDIISRKFKKTAPANTAGKFHAAKEAA